MQVGGLLLTGGASSRLGVPKHEILRDGERLADRAARVLSSICQPSVEVGPGVTTLLAVREDPSGEGPLAGLAAGLEVLRSRGHDGPVLVLAVDLPFVEPELLAWVAAYPAAGSVVPIVDDRAQSLCARYSVAALDAVPGVLKRGERSMRALLDALEDVVYVDETAWGAIADPITFTDVDTPDDLTQLAGFGVELPQQR